MILKTKYLLFLSFLLFSCEKRELPKKNRSEIHINFTSSPQSTDPRKNTDPFTCTLNFMLYEGLTHLEENGEITLGIAEKVEISEDKTTYVFHLKNSYWSDGNPLTAYDFERSWKSALSPDFPSKSAELFFPIKNAEEVKKGNREVDSLGVKALNEKTLQVILALPTPYFLELTSYCTYFPIAANQQNQLVSNGPFKLHYWKHDDEIIVRKNPYFWNVDQIAIDSIIINIIHDEKTALYLFEKNQLDWLGGAISTLPLDAIPSLKKSNRLKQRPIAGSTFCVFNTNRFPFTNVNIRKAFSYSIDRESITENIIQMGDIATTALIPPLFKKGISTLFFKDNNISLARKHFELGLKELGITKEEFPSLIYNSFNSELHSKISLALQNQWHNALGIHVELEQLEFGVHLQKLQTRNFSFAQMSWIAQFHDQMNFLGRFFEKDSFRNYSGWENGEYSLLLTKSSSLSKSEEREDLLLQAESLLMDEMPIAPISHFHAVYLEKPYIKNVTISPLGDVQFRNAYLSTNE